MKDYAKRNIFINFSNKLFPFLLISLVNSRARHAHQLFRLHVTGGCWERLYWQVLVRLIFDANVNKVKHCGPCLG